jgi:hypothetical protein
MALQGIHHDDGRVETRLTTMKPDGSDIQAMGHGLGDEHQAEWSGEAIC